jgi:peptidoglycan/LPS O-acetylase OafA/YrhL
MNSINNPLIDPKNRIYYLDLLRAAAIMLVFTAHAISSYGPTAITGPLQFGGTGVDLFFLLSGWLIGSQLFSEQEKFGDIELKRFWLRRWMRTFPAYFAVLFFTLAQLYLTKDSVSNPLPYFVFTQNYYYPLEYFSISWSLAVEEQFYLAIAPIVLLLSRIKSIKIQFLILLILLLAPSFFRFYQLYDAPEETHVRWDCCLLGVLLAFIKNRMGNVWQLVKQKALTICIVSVLLYLMLFWFRWDPPFENYSDPSKLVLAFIFAGMVIKAATTPIEKLPYIHNIIMHISTRSYSIYLLHPEALAACNRLVSDQHIIFYYSSALCISLLAAEILYRAVEVPFIKLRDNFQISSKRKVKPLGSTKAII